MFFSNFSKNINSISINSFRLFCLFSKDTECSSSPLISTHLSIKSIPSRKKELQISLVQHTCYTDISSYISKNILESSIIKAKMFFLFSSIIFVICSIFLFDEFGLISLFLLEKNMQEFLFSNIKMLSIKYNKKKFLNILKDL